MCKSENCQLPNEDTSEYCILHCKKDDWYTLIQDFPIKGNTIKQYDTTKVKLFWETLRGTINKERASLLGYPFNNIIFPEFESNGLSYRDYTTNSFFEDKEANEFSSKVIFKYCTFEGNNFWDNFKFKRGLSFENCCFPNEADFKIYNINESLIFINCHFYGKLSLARKYNVPVKFINCYFYNNELNLNNIVFNDTFILKNDTESSEHIKLTAENTYFNGIADFANTKFDTINLEGTAFEKLVLFKNSTVKSKFNLESTTFKDEANFLGIKNGEKQKLESKNIANRETARIIKHSFEKLDNIIEANKFYALEMEKQEEELKWGEHFADKLIFKFHQISSNHSQDWLLVLLWMLNITFVYSAYKHEICFNDQWLYMLNFLTIGVLISLIECLALLEIEDKYKIWFFVGFGFINYLIYGLLTCDYSLCFVANDFNPFSIMTGKDTLTFGTLIYKAIIAYLIYQFIVSIRQNTRRQ